MYAEVMISFADLESAWKKNDEAAGNSFLNLGLLHSLQAVHIFLRYDTVFTTDDGGSFGSSVLVSLFRIFGMFFVAIGIVINVNDSGKRLL